MMQAERWSVGLSHPETIGWRGRVLFQDLFVSCLKVLVGVETKDKPLVRTENSFLVSV